MNAKHPPNSRRPTPPTRLSLADLHALAASEAPTVSPADTSTTADSQDPFNADIFGLDLSPISPATSHLPTSHLPTSLPPTSTSITDNKSEIPITTENTTEIQKTTEEQKDAGGDAVISPHKGGIRGGCTLTGEVATADSDRGLPSVPDDQPTVIRESKAVASNRWVREGRRWEVDKRRGDLIRQGRAAGMSKEDARERAWDMVLAEFPPPGCVAAIQPLPQVATVDPPREDQAEATEASSPATESPQSDADPAAAISTEGQVTGLATIPPSWPALPPTASLAADVGWVQSSRLDVVEQLAGGRYRVDLSRADRPAPSKSALSWLETSISFPAKFADVSVKAAQGTTDEQAEVRREKLSIEEVRRLLAEMVTARTEAAAVEAEAGAG